ncbi:AraC family transcriptional regulator [Scatolibacter rhodanostii]|uniref:AraC family transcriptional regulator n=1 Tax=Scatolibacter rhodanostii TaxID=2014781 RepID=UPI000C06DB5E|nr:helix-turn-helix domain-containing protein [Scatolibacter rhodanostii]
MNTSRGIDTFFSKEDIVNSIKQWNLASVSLIDIRHNLIFSKESLSRYRLPANMFLYTSGISGEVIVNHHSYQLERFGLFHAEKGAELSILPSKDWLEYYMIFYDRKNTLSYHKKYVQHHELISPFQQPYGFIPENPLFFAEHMRKMYEAWKHPLPLELFYAKSSFYQFIYEVHKELERGKFKTMQPNLPAIIKRYMEEHYDEALSIHTLAASLNISDSHLRRNFKEQFRESPQGYLVNVRLLQAKKLLVNTDFSIRSVAAACGFSDEFNFSKVFMKNFGLSPKNYRAKTPNQLSDFIMDTLPSFPYNEKSQVRIDKLKGEGANFMLKNFKSKTIMAAAMAFMLLLSACAPATNTSEATSQPSSSVSSQVSEKTESDIEQTGTRVVSTSTGEVEVPVNPQRVVVQYLMGDVVALGITPVGVSDVYDGAAFSDLVADSVSLGWFPEWEEESVMKLDPDLILVIGDENVEKYNKIAPTILIPYDTMTQSERITFMGDVLNRQEEAAKLLSDYASGLEEAKTKLLQAGFDQYTISVFEGGADAKMSVKGNQYGTGSIVYKELGIAAPEGVKTNIIDKDSGGEQVSFEVLAQYSGDFIIRNTYEGMADLSEDAIWNSLPAVINNRVIEIEFGLSYYPDILSATAQLNYITESLLSAAK